MTDGISIEELRKHPEFPESEFEWEDLLLRLEIMSRALRVEMENETVEDVQPVVAELAAREAVVQRLLEEVAGVEPNPVGAAGAPPLKGGDAANQDTGREALSSDEITTYADPSEASAAALVDRFLRLRSRNFAMLQRRGIEVWKWRIHSAPAAGVTVYQLLSLLVRGDVETLERLRRARTALPGPC